MSSFQRTLSALFAIVTGLSVFVTAIFQTITKTGYTSRPAEEIAENYLEGSQVFIDEAVSDKWQVGYGKMSLTPEDTETYKYYLGGFLKFPAQEATGVLDDICVRAVCLDDGSGRGAAAFAWIDAVGIMNADIKAVRAQLADITGDGKLISIDIGATHAHSAVDTQGLWGTIPKSGRDQKYMDVLIERAAQAIRTAYTSMTSGDLYYSSRNCAEMFKDSRNPQSFDENIHLFRFVPDEAGRKEIYIANFGAHPVNMGYDNTLLSGDYPYYIEKSISSHVNADFAFIQGAIGGGIGLNKTAENGVDLEQSDLQQITEYSDRMASIIIDLANSGEKIKPILNVRHMQVDFVVDNFVFKLAERAKMCNVNAYIDDGEVKLTSEIGYLEIGDGIKVLQVPGEVLPEVVYGGFYSADEAFNGTEYPYAPLNNLFTADDDLLVFGLCNDALGYFVPDNDYSASNQDGHYEETVSTGSHSASTLSDAFERLVGEWG